MYGLAGGVGTFWSILSPESVAGIEEKRREVLMYGVVMGIVNFCTNSKDEGIKIEKSATSRDFDIIIGCIL